MRHGTSRHAILALIKKRSGLLPGKRTDQKPNTFLNNLKFRRRLAVKRARNHFQPFVLSNPYIVAFDDCARGELFRQ